MPMSSRTRSFAGACGIALGAVLAATLVRFALHPAVGDNYPLTTYFLAMVLVSWFGRTGQATLTLVLGGLLGAWLFVPAHDTVTVAVSPSTAVAMYLAVGGVIVAMSHSMRGARYRAESSLA